MAVESLLSGDTHWIDDMEIAMPRSPQPQFRSAYRPACEFGTNFSSVGCSSGEEPQLITSRVKRLSPARQVESIQVKFERFEHA
ncbi:hypothetical protein Enr8_23270 [Blastopirellula retiformator]|uniref:Uncharacterized protein n=1 Tax=Blastopirellula retiformator TaxID=2527970 RepID=A0A5C5VB48_9BACT|nr:hypothetical protein Enr8_23270 [Blastopirellula retiformator]